MKKKKRERWGGGGGGGGGLRPSIPLTMKSGEILYATEEVLHVPVSSVLIAFFFNFLGGGAGGGVLFSVLCFSRALLCRLQGSLF